MILLENQGLGNELIDLYKLAKQYGIEKLETEACQRLHQKLSGIMVEGSVEGGAGKIPKLK